MLVRGRAARTALLRGATAAIPVGGLVLVPSFVRPPVRYFSVAHIVARLVHRLTRRGRGETPELGDALSPNYVHYFTRNEIVGEAADVGLAPGRIPPAALWTRTLHSHAMRTADMPDRRGASPRRRLTGHLRSAG